MGLRKPSFLQTLVGYFGLAFQEPVAKFLSPSTKLVSPLSLPAPGDKQLLSSLHTNDCGPCAEHVSKVTPTELLLVAGHQLSNHNQVIMPRATVTLELLAENCHP